MVSEWGNRAALVAVGGASALFTALALAVHGKRELGWDEAVLDLLARFPVASSDVHVDPFVTAVTLAVGALLAVVVVVLLARRRFRAAAAVVVGVGGAVALSTLVKGVVERPPIEGSPDEFSFPSGNATWSMASATALGLLSAAGRRLRAVLVAGAVLVVGVAAVITWEEWHYPSDVVAGWCLAVAWVTVVWLALRRPRLA